MTGSVAVRRSFSVMISSLTTTRIWSRVSSEKAQTAPAVIKKTVSAAEKRVLRGMSGVPSVPLRAGLGFRGLFGVIEAGQLLFVHRDLGLALEVLGQPGEQPGLFFDD